jgi:hypothetical protein
VAVATNHRKWNSKDRILQYKRIAAANTSSEMQKEFLNSTKHNGKSKEVVARQKKSEDGGK